MKKLGSLSLLFFVLTASAEDNFEKAIKALNEKNYNLAISLLKEDCSKNIGKSCEALGEIYREGLGVNKDYSKAKYYYEKACELNNISGCNNLGLLYDKGLGVDKDYNKAKYYYEKACNLDDISGCYNLGLLYYKGLGVDKDYYKAKYYFGKTCNLGYKPGCYNLGYLYHTIEKDYNKAKYYYEKACSLNDSSGCYNLGYLYTIEKDYNKAKYYYEKACSLNDSSGCYNLGYLYHKGLGVDRDYNKAKYYYEKACNLGYKPGCYNLGYLYDTIEKDYNKAKYYYEKACSLNDSFGCNNLGYLYTIEKDYNKAKYYYEKACSLNNSSGCNNLGNLYYDGLGVNKDYSKAKYYYEKACNLGNNDGCNNAKRLKQKQKREEQALKQKVLNYLNGNLNWNGGGYIVCSNGTTEFEIIKSQIGDLMSDLTDTRFMVKANINLETFCNNLSYIYQTGTKKQLKKLFYLLAEALVNAENNSLDGFPKMKRALEMRYTIDIANTSHMFSHTFSGTLAFKGHLVLTRIIGNIIRQSVMFDKKIPDRDIKVIRLLLTGKISKALKEADKLVSDKELRKVEEDIKNIYKIK